MSFQPLSDLQLDALADDELIGYIRKARSTGELNAGKRALAILVYGHLPRVRARIALKVAGHAVEDLASDALIRAVTAAFDGSSVGEFHAWLNTIVSRQIVDYYRAQERQLGTTSLPSEHVGEDNKPGFEPSVPSDADAVDFQIVCDSVLVELDGTHREVVELHVFSGLPAKTVCDRIPGMSEANVAQIASRFRKRLRERLDLDGVGNG